MIGIRRLLADRAGASAAEFVLVLPLALLFLLGMIDVGRFMWEYNQAEKATQMGVRYAVSTELVPSGLRDYSFAVNDGIPAGDAVPSANFGSAVCDENACTCTGGGVCAVIGYNADAFDATVQRMAAMYPRIQSGNVVIEYRNVGLGFAGTPDVPDPDDPDCPNSPPYPSDCTLIMGPDVAPLVTVRLTDMQFQPLSGRIFGANIAMPDFRAALTLEDGSGTVAN